MPLNLEHPEWSLVLPQLIVLATVLVVSMLDAFLPKAKHYGTLTGASIIGYLLALIVQFSQAGQTGSTFHGLFRLDGMTVFFNIVILLAAILTVMVSASYVEYLDGSMGTGEFYTLLSFATLGAMITASAGDMVMIYVGVELTSVATYILTAYAKRRSTALEGALKYTILGIFASAILLYGMAWIYGGTGSTNLDVISANIAAIVSGDRVDSGLVFGLLLLVVGFGFKLAAVPFHYWTPDAYDGAPTPVTAWMSVVPKAVGFVALIRMFGQGLEPLVDQWHVVLAIVAFITMFFGNIVAISQRNVKRMLAYSSIAHTGYVLAGVAAYRLVDGVADERSISAVMYYLLAYAFMNIGAFAIIVWVQQKGEGFELDDFAGLASRAPLAALAMTVFLVSLMGIPPTIGFYGKYYVIVALLNADMLWLAISVVLASAISAYFYLRVVVFMYFQEKAKPAPEDPGLPDGLINAGLWVMAVGVIVLGLFSTPIINLANDWVNGWAAPAAVAMLGF